MKTGIVLCFILLLMACEYEGIEPSTAVPFREIHYNFETGERVGTKTFAYDVNNNLLFERFVNELKNNFPNDFEVIYERDGEGRLIKRKERYPDVDSEFHVQETKYDGALKVSEKSYYSDHPENFEERLYYYTGTVLDSTVRSFTSADKGRGGIHSEQYSYDDQGRLTQVYFPGFKITHTFQYDNGKVTKCISDFCTITEYNKAGQLTKLSESNPEYTQVNEEYFYKNGRLDEKIIYTHAAYLVPGLVVTWKIKYEY